MSRTWSKKWWQAWHVTEQEENRDVPYAQSSPYIYENTSENTYVNTERDIQIRKCTNTKKGKQGQIRDTETQHGTHIADTEQSLTSVFI